MAGKLTNPESENIKQQIANYQEKNDVHAHHLSVSVLQKLIEENPDIVGLKIEHAYDENNVHSLVISGVNKESEIVSNSCIIDGPPCPPDCKITFE
ncbi:MULTISPECIES: hypothetical protein [unclassified Arcicella]|uniref:hypothetical protein n=1 Tax=unclassified Arcicella TaxID=2644986 RepID=UPI002865FD84|nr:MULTISPECIES: hypothetical protein [unclassified Arcicella]MDR6561117.1 hypothetical protein [Arcicella sp. BE51]MDR6811001.1 hypothetical protein [Arcicella sp. BE140]MDR6822351.1 hypothetical protein [Arcicella sp. BE139]